MDHCPGSTGCKCKLHYGLYEWAFENLSATHGLEPAPRVTVRIVIEPEPMQPVRGQNFAHHPWMPRPSRHAQHRAA